MVQLLRYVIALSVIGNGETLPDVKQTIYAFGDQVFGKQGVVFALLTAQLGMLLEYYLVVFTPRAVAVLAALHASFAVTVFLYAKRERLENGFVGTLETQADKRTNRELDDFE